MNAGDASGSRISLPLRLWLFVEIAFGLAAIASITLFPTETATNFAWPIKPDVTAALLGAFYLASAGVFVVAAFVRRWEFVRVMVVPAIIFTFTELIATFLHWDRFSVGTLPFNVWFASYLLPPPIFAACYVWHQRRAVAVEAARPLPSALRLIILVIGAAMTIEALAAFVWPQVLISTAPWQLTPLTTRALCGWLLALGTLVMSVALENDRDRTIVAAPFLILVGPAIALQLLRFAPEVDWSHPRIAIGAVVVSFLCAMGIYLGLGDRRRLFR